MHPEYTFIGSASIEYDFATEIGISTKMFNQIGGEGGIAIQDITVLAFAPMGVWMPTPANDVNFGSAAGSMYRLYGVELRHKILSQNLYYLVEGPVIVYAAETDEGWKLLGFVELAAGGKATENHSWSSVKALFE